MASRRCSSTSPSPDSSDPEKDAETERAALWANLSHNSAPIFRFQSLRCNQPSQIAPLHSEKPAVQETAFYGHVQCVNYSISVSCASLIFVQQAGRRSGQAHRAYFRKTRYGSSHVIYVAVSNSNKNKQAHELICFCCNFQSILSCRLPGSGGSGPGRGFWVMKLFRALSVGRTLASSGLWSQTSCNWSKETALDFSRKANKTSSLIHFCSLSQGSTDHPDSATTRDAAGDSSGLFRTPSSSLQFSSAIYHSFHRLRHFQNCHQQQ